MIMMSPLSSLTWHQHAACLNVEFDKTPGDPAQTAADGMFPNVCKVDGAFMHYANTIQYFWKVRYMRNDDTRQLNGVFVF